MLVKVERQLEQISMKLSDNPSTILEQVAAVEADFLEMDC